MSFLCAFSVLTGNTTQISKVHVTLIAFETFKRPEGVDSFVTTRRKTPTAIAKEVNDAYQPSASSTGVPRSKPSYIHLAGERSINTTIQDD